MFKNKTQIVMMAAGFGSRVGEITQHIPKAFIPINGKPMIERHIEFMIEAGISRLIMTVGYKKEQYAYLVEKYKGQLEIIQVLNPYYKDYNTFSTIFVASEYFDRDTFFTAADLYLAENIYAKYGWKPEDEKTYGFYLHKMVKDLEKPEWVVNLADDELGHYITSVNKSGLEGSMYSSVSFWTKKDLEFIYERLHEADWDDPALKKIYWDELLFPWFDKWHAHVRHMECNEETLEVDDENDLRILKEYVHDPVSVEDLKISLGIDPGM